MLKIQSYSHIFFIHKYICRIGFRVAKKQTFSGPSRIVLSENTRYATNINQNSIVDLGTPEPIENIDSLEKYSLRSFVVF